MEFGINVIYKLTVSIVLLFELEKKEISDRIAIDSLLKSVAHNLEVDVHQLEQSLKEVNAECNEKFKEEKSRFKTNVTSLTTLLYTSMIDWIEDCINIQLKLG